MLVTIALGVCFLNFYYSPLTSALMSWSAASHSLLVKKDGILYIHKYTYLTVHTSSFLRVWASAGSKLKLIPPVPSVHSLFPPCGLFTPYKAFQLPGRRYCPCRYRPVDWRCRLSWTPFTLKWWLGGPVPDNTHLISCRLWTFEIYSL